MYISITVWDTLAVKIKVLFFHCWNNTESIRGNCELNSIKGFLLTFTNQMSRALLDWDVTRNPKMALQPCFCKLWFFAINIQLPFHFNWKVAFHNFFCFSSSTFFFRLSALVYLPSSFPPTPLSYLLSQPTSFCLSLFSNLLSFFPSSLNSQIKIYLDFAQCVINAPSCPCTSARSSFGTVGRLCY